MRRVARPPTGESGIRPLGTGRDMTAPQETAPEPENPEVKEGDVTENPSKPSEDGAEPSADPGENPDASPDSEDSSTTAPVDADEGDPDLDAYPG